MLQSFTDLIYENNKALSADVSDEIILRFKRDERKAPGITTSGEIRTDIKKSIDLNISVIEEWKDIDKILFESLKKDIDRYREKMEKIIDIPLWSNKIKDDGYNVKEYKPGDYYNWHIDCQTYQSGWTRTVACIWYLNAVEEGGETEFAFGHKVVPNAGKLILFPATWNFPHRGLSPIKGNKYIITSFVLTNEETQHG